MLQWEREHSCPWGVLSWGAAPFQSSCGGMHVTKHGETLCAMLPWQL